MILRHIGHTIGCLLGAAIVGVLFLWVLMIILGLIDRVIG